MLRTDLLISRGGSRGDSLGAEAPPLWILIHTCIINSQLVTEEAGLHCTYLSYQLAPPGKALFTPA